MLAVERTHDMAAGLPFIVPVAVDEPQESAAIVPDELLRVCERMGVSLSSACCFRHLIENRELRRGRLKSTRSSSFAASRRARCSAASSRPARFI